VVSGNYWNEKIETLPREEIQKLQLPKLKEQVEYCYSNSVFYRKKFDNIGLKLESIQTFEDFGKIPFTVKADLKQFSEFATQYQINLDQPRMLDTFLIQVELTKQAQTSTRLDLKQLQQMYSTEYT